jgi:hypothetical protein
MAMRARPTGVVIAILLALAACSDSSDSTRSGDPSDADQTSTTAAQQMRDAPEDGACRPIPPRRWEDPEYVADDTPVVDCSQRHTSETVAVYPLDNVDVDFDAEAGPGPEYVAAYERCQDDARALLGTSDHQWIPWTAGVYLPTPDQVEGGARWGRCDVIFQASTDTPRPRWVSFPAENAAVAHADELWGCLDRDPWRLPHQSYVACDAPHGYEATGTIVGVHGLRARPTEAQLRDAARDCEPFLSEEEQGRPITVLWHQSEEVEASVYGACFTYRADGRPLPPR